MTKLVRDAMTANPRTVLLGMTVREAARMMEAEDVGSIPVVDKDGFLAGVITDRDIVLRVVAAGREPDSTVVDEVATGGVFPAYPEEPLDEALEQMAYHQVRRLPVIENDRVIGILAQADVAQQARAKKTGQLVETISQPGDDSRD
jgi:CBS domain-containing protein